MKLVPLGDRVVLKQLVAEETTKSGIVIPGQSKDLVAEETTKSGIVIPGQSKEKPQQAEVLAVGPGGTVDGKEVKMNVSVGQTVIYSKYAGTTVEIEDEEYIIVKQDDILAIVE